MISFWPFLAQHVGERDVFKRSSSNQWPHRAFGVYSMQRKLILDVADLAALPRRRVFLTSSARRPD